MYMNKLTTDFISGPNWIHTVGCYPIRYRFFPNIVISLMAHIQILFSHWQKRPTLPSITGTTSKIYLTRQDSSYPQIRPRSYPHFSGFISSMPSNTARPTTRTSQLPKVYMISWTSRQEKNFQIRRQMKSSCWRWRSCGDAILEIQLRSRV